MNPTEQGFIEAIRQEGRKNNASRLIYADWLADQADNLPDKSIEQGELLYRAKYIRLQIASEQAEAQEKELRLVLEDRLAAAQAGPDLEALRNSHEEVQKQVKDLASWQNAIEHFLKEDWVKADCGAQFAPDDVTYRRGMVDHIIFTGEKWHKHAPRLLRKTPFTKAEILDWPKVENMLDVPELMRSPLLAKLDELSIFAEINPATVTAIARSPHLAGLTRLHLMHPSCRIIRDESREILKNASRDPNSALFGMEWNDLTATRSPELAQEVTERLAQQRHAAGVTARRANRGPRAQGG